jgi:peptide/nickel transport system permease protein
MVQSYIHYWCTKFLSLCGILLVVGLLPHLLPGPPFALYENWPALPQQRTLLIKEYGFDRSLPVQYSIWLQRIFTGHWGQSRFHSRPVLPEVMQAATFTLLLLLWTGLTWGLWVGILWGYRRLFSRPSVPAPRGLLITALKALPNFLLAVILHDLATWQFGWTGMANVSLWQPYAVFNPFYMLFPGTILAVTPLLAWYSSAAVSHSADRPPWQQAGVRWRHFCRELQPLLAGFLLEVLLTEHVLTLPGLGSLGITALKRRDFPLFQGFLLCAAGLYFLVHLAFDQHRPAPNTPQSPCAALASNHCRQIAYSGAWGLVVLLALAALATQLAPYNPTEIHSHDQLLRPGYRYFLGTDFLGRDVLSRTINGFRSTIPHVMLLTVITGSVAWIGLRLLHLLPHPCISICRSGAAVFEAFPPFLLACMVFLIVEPLPHPLEATLILACLPSAGRLLATQTSLPQKLVWLAQLGERLLMLEVLFFFLNLSPESLTPTWGSDIRHGMNYGHLNIWLIFAPTLAVVWSRYIFQQLSLYTPAVARLTTLHRLPEAARD